MDQITGLKQVLDFITVDEEKTLLEKINNNQWDTTLKRRTQQYGHRYQYTKGTKGTKDTKDTKDTNTQSNNPAEVPEYLYELFLKCHQDIKDPSLLQVIINEYLPGQGIADHIDDPKKFTNWVITISLGSNCIMNFKSNKTIECIIPLFLNRRSMYLMKDDARYVWTHGIPPRKSDTHLGTKHMRGIRISITFREML